MTIQEAYKQVTTAKGKTILDKNGKSACTISGNTIVFHASNSLSDWVSDFIFFKRSVPFLYDKRMKAHRGVLSVYKYIAPEVYKYLPEGKLTIIGYSLGASLASLFALYLTLKGRDVKVYAFEPLRIGNRRYRELYNRTVPKTIYTTYGNDTVTKLPPACFNFHHVGLEFHYGKTRNRWQWNHKDHPLENLKTYLD